jgi:catechol 2,3-dioxygenase-like lactoylglutathione lyase family enzyme
MPNNFEGGALAQGAQVMAFVAITDRDRARRFYGDALSLKFVMDDGFALIFEHSGTTLRAAIVREVHPAPCTVLGWQVEEIDASVAALEKAGVRLETFPGLNQNEHGIWDAPGGRARVAWFRDPDGNLLSLSQHEKGIG